MIEAKSVSMNYGKTSALNKVSFTAEKGKVLGLLGPNGAGKTTLMRILTTYLYPTHGTAIVDGHDVIKEPLIVRGLIGYMPETVPLYDDMIVDEYLAFIGRARGLDKKGLRDRLRWVRESCGITEVWKHAISELSKGFRQRVGIAQALIHDPRVLILDEPTAGLDPLQIIDIRNLIHKLAKEKTIIFSTHILQEVEALADRIVILNNGLLIANGSRREIVQMAAKGKQISITVKAEREEVKEALAADDTVGDARFIGFMGEAWVKFLVSAETGQPVIPHLNKIMADKHWELKEMKEEEPTLEEAFIWLLSKGIRA